MQASAQAFLAEYFATYAPMAITENLASFEAAVSGKKEDFERMAAADAANKKFHADAEKYQKVIAFLGHRDELDPLTVRALEVAHLAFKSNQLPETLLEQLSQQSAAIGRALNTYRPKIGDKSYSNNELAEMMRKERRSKKRQQIWEALKQVGQQIAPQIVELAKLRNKGARMLGDANFWEMTVKLQEFEPDQLLAIFAELESLTDEPFKAVKGDIDKEMARRFKVKSADLMPWHYDNPFFQAPPPSAKIDLDKLYRGKTKEAIVEITERQFADIGLPVNEVMARSDLYEREGKDQHAYSFNIDRAGDVRTLMNIKPTARWMETSLHEAGHAIYSSNIDPALPFNLREAAHMFTTEGIAMLMGALSNHPDWIVKYIGAPAKKVRAQEKAIWEQGRRGRLVFARWTMVMFHFEKALYENPDQNLDVLWWDLVERFQLLKRPQDRQMPDWAAKPHFTIAPVYYHNYMLGELFAAQLRAALAKRAKDQGPTQAFRFNDRQELGNFLREEVFKPGMRWAWPEFVKKCTGESLTARFFAQELQER